MTEETQTTTPTPTEEAAKEIEIILEEPQTEESPEQEPVVEEPVSEASPEPEVEAPSEIDTLKAELADIKSKMDAPEQKNLQEQIQETPIPTPEPVVEDIPNLGDPITDPEAYNRNLLKYMKERDEKVTKNAVEQLLNSERMQTLEMSHYSREHQFSVDKAKNEFGEAFNYEQEGQTLTQMQQKLPGLTVGDAHRVHDYDRVLNELNQLKEGQMERKKTQPNPPTAPTRMTDTSGGKSVKLTSSQKETALKYGRMRGLSDKDALQSYARGKQRQSGELEE